jgi:hypothetical protein
VADSGMSKPVRMAVLLVGAIVLAVGGLAGTLFVQDLVSRRAIQQGAERFAVETKAQQDAAMAWHQAKAAEPVWTDPQTRDPLVRGIRVRVLSGHMYRTRQPFPTLDKDVPDAVRPGPDLDRRFAAAFGPTGLKEARVAVAPGARLKREFDREYHAYRMREVDAYLRHTPDEGEAKIAGEAFLRLFTEDLLRVRNDGESHEETLTRLRDAGVAALVAGSRDPLVAGSYADTYNPHRHELKEAIGQALAQAMAFREGTNYPALLDLRLSTTLRWVHRWSKGVTDIDARGAFPPAAIARWLKEESSDPTRVRCVWRRLSNVMSAPNIEWNEVLYRAIEEGGVDPWLLRMIAGQMYEGLAWKARGNGFANTVSEEGARAFQTGLARAADCYREAWLAHPERPESAWRMIAIANTGSSTTETPADWFEKALAVEFDSPEPYEIYANYLLPRWGGSYPAMLQFARGCLDTGRFDTIVPNRLLDLFQQLDLYEEVPRDKVFEVMPGLEAAALDYVRGLSTIPEGETGDVVRADRLNRAGGSILVDVLSQAGHVDVARALALEWPAEQRLTQLGQKGRPREFEFARIRATTSANGELVESLVADLVRAPLEPVTDDMATSLRERVAKLKAEGNSETDRLAGCFEELLAQRLAWGRGDWVEIDPATGTLTLAYEAESVHRDETARTVRLEPDPFYTTQLGAACLLPFRYPFEVEAVVDTRPFEISIEGGGFQWDAAPGTERPYSREEFETGAEVTRPFVGYARAPMEGIHLPRTAAGPVFEMDYNSAFPGTARWKVWPESYEFSYNETGFRGDFFAPLDPTGRLWIGEPHALEKLGRPALSIGEMHIGRVRLRKLATPAPLPRTAPFADRLAAAKQDVEARPDDHFAKLYLAELYVESNPELVPPLIEELRATRPALRGLDSYLSRALTRLGKLDEADVAALRAFDSHSLGQIALVEHLRIHLQREGLKSPELQKYQGWMHEMKGMVHDSWMMEISALIKYAELETRDTKTYPAARAEMLREALGLLSNGVKAANPGPRRDELTALLEKWRQELATIEQTLSQ